MIPKYSPICNDFPNKYPQNLHTLKNIYFSEKQKNIEVQNFHPPPPPKKKKKKKRDPSLRIYENIRVPPYKYNYLLWFSKQDVIGKYQWNTKLHGLVDKWPHSMGSFLSSQKLSALW